MNKNKNITINFIHADKNDENDEIYTIGAKKVPVKKS